MNVLNIMMGKGAGGLEKAALDAHHGLSMAGCQVTTVLNSSSPISEKFSDQSQIIQFYSPVAFDPTAPTRLKWKLKNKKFDIVLVHGNRAARLAREIRKFAPIVLVCHTTNYSAKKMIHKIDGAIVLTRHYQDVMRKNGLPESKMRLVPNSVDIGPEPLPAEDRPIPIIGGLGRLVSNKGFDVLLAALSEMKKNGIKFKCVICGVDEHNETREFESLRDKSGLTSDDVEFPGWTSNPSQFLQSLDIFCMPSRREVLSLALLEALAAGRPIVCSRIPGLEDVFDDQKEGLFVDIGDVAGLQKALTMVINDPTMRIKMGHAARERARRFDTKNVGKELCEALEYFSIQQGKS